MSLILALFTFGLPARAWGTFTAARNISQRLETQGQKVGQCSDVNVFMLTTHDIDGDHDYFGIEGKDGSGQPFSRMKPMGTDAHYRPKVRRRSDGVYVVYVYRSTPLNLDAWGTRQIIYKLHVDGGGRITDIETPRGEHLCSNRPETTVVR